MIYTIFTTALSYKPIRRFLQWAKQRTLCCKMVPMLNEWHEKDYIFQSPTLNLIGHNAVKNFSEITKKCKYHNPIIVTDTFLITAGITKYITDSLSNDAFKYTIFDKVIPNPTIAVVEQIVASYKTNQCDGIISIGGGSAHDAAKAAGFVLSNPKPIRLYQGINVTKSILKMPLVCVNTTAGTGSEVTNVAVITDEMTHFKMTLTDKNMIATASVNDSIMMMGLPPKTTAWTGVDALVHAIEANMSIYTNTIVKAHSRKAIQMICQWLPAAFANPKNVEAREKMACAEFMAGTAFNCASLGFIHSLSHAMSAIFNTPHGLANAVLMPYVMDYELHNHQAVIHIAKLATYMELTVNSEHIMDKAKAVIEFIIRLLKKTQIPTNLNNVQPNISKAQITSMAKKAMKDFCGISNITQLSRHEVKHIYQNAINGHFDHINMKG